MSSTEKVLGTIGALNTLIENFPMSIFDLSRGKIYTSSFEFIMDILYAAGVNPTEIISFLLEEIYSININIENGLEGIKEDIAQLDFTKTNQSPFLMTLENGIKDILKTLLSSIFGCTAIPVLPNHIMDYPNKNKFPKLDTHLWDSSIFPLVTEIPIKLIDPMGMLEITPTSLDGRVFYDIPGSDIYYRKEKKIQNTAFSFKRIINYIDNPINIKINNNIINFELNNKITEDLIIEINYIRNGSRLSFKTIIKANETVSTNNFDIKNVNVIDKITINNMLEGTIASNNNWCYLVENENAIFYNIKWGVPFEKEALLGASNEDSNYSYVPLSDVPKDSKNAKRVNSVPTFVGENDADLIVVYQGISSNELYKTFDMNAFIWYSLVKGSLIPQKEKNLMMWDSRLSAFKKGFERVNQSNWDEWYNSKVNSTDEFKYLKNDIDNTSPLFPIIQLSKSPLNNYAINISLPAQRYFKPKARLNPNKNPNSCFNSTIYQFNNDYLDSIQILKPKLMLTGLVNHMLGLTLTTLKNTKIDFSKKIIEGKISNAIKNVIEMDDMETEDCFTSFSNEEFDKMLEEMILSKYSINNFDNNFNDVKEHDINYYIALIDSFNASANKEESISKMTRLVNEVITTTNEESSIDYNINITSNINGELLNKLLWAIAYPIIESLFTPQVMLLLIINMYLMGIVKIDNFANNDLTIIMNLLLNKILGLTKSIIIFIKEKIIELLLKLFSQKIAPLLIKANAALAKEKIDDWLIILTAALKCLPRFKFNKKNIINNIDDVDYADIYNTETSSPVILNNNC